MYNIIFEKTAKKASQRGRNDVDRIKLVNAENLNLRQSKLGIPQCEIV